MDFSLCWINYFAANTYQFIVISAVYYRSGLVNHKKWVSLKVALPALWLSLEIKDSHFLEIDHSIRNRVWLAHLLLWPFSLHQIYPIKASYDKQVFHCSSIKN